MPTQITIGLDLDNTTASPHATILGQLLGGPNVLLQWLESQLGLEQPPASQTQRVLQYLACLKQCDNDNRFYHASIAVDELGVARRILQWRDAWYEAGWRGSAFVDANLRLSDIAEVEQIAATAVALNTGLRLQHVLAVLPESGLPVTVTSLDAIDQYPAGWQRLLLQLNAQYKPPHNAVRAETGSDLARLQLALLSGEIPIVPNGLRGDGSVVVFNAPSPGISAPWVAQYTKALLASVNDYQIGMLCNGPAEELDLALEQAGVATLATGALSPWRPVFQVLPLVMELLWAPLNPNRLLEFLSHPVGPIKRRVRRALAEVVAQEPGIGGTVWLAAVAELLEQEADSCSDDAEAKKAVKKLSTAIEYWLTGERFKPHPGAPVELVIKRALAVNTWLSGVINLLADDVDKEAEQALYVLAQYQVSEFVTALQLLGEQGEEFINADTLRRLVASVRGEGANRPDRMAQLISGQSKLCAASSAASFIAPLQTTIWWGCDRASLSDGVELSQQELRQLGANGVVLPDSGEQVTRQASNWLRPILAAQQQLVLVVHNSGNEHHPVFDQINALVEGMPQYDVLGLMQGLHDTTLPGTPQAIASEALLLPGKQRYWRLPAGTAIPKRDAESYSSLESFLFGPYMWVLRYQAKLRAGSLLAVSDDNLLKGNLAHHLFENFFNAHKDIGVLEGSSVASWAAEALKHLIEDSGSVLLMHGRAAEREQFVVTTVNALVRLVAHLQAAQVVSVAMETSVEGSFTGGTLTGYLDLLATNATGEQAVIDIKWGGAKYRRQSMQNSGYLQLAIYAQVHQQGGAAYPAVGYFVIASQELLMLNSDYFAEAEVVAPANEENIAQFWQRFQRSWRQRRGQLDKGLIEVNVRGTEPDDALSLGGDGLAMPEVYDSFSEFAVLVGWEAQA